VELGRRQFYLSQDPATPEGRSIREVMADDPYHKDWKPVPIPELAERLREIDTMLATPEMVAIADEYRRTRKVRGGKPTWYSLYDGPRNVQKLAQSLNRGASYVLLYRQWSERSHSADVVDRILTHGSGGQAVRGLRDVGELNSAIDFAIEFSIEAARCMIRYYRSDEETAFERWIGTEILPIWTKMPKIVVKATVSY
jgi:hypothetical protein